MKVLFITWIMLVSSLALAGGGDGGGHPQGDPFRPHPKTSPTEVMGGDGGGPKSAER